MTQNDQVKQSIQDFYALWQEQCAAINHDADATKHMFAMGEQVYHSLNQVMQQAYATKHTQEKSESGTSADPDIYGDSVHAVALLHARLVECEKRIAELENALAEKSKSPEEEHSACA